MRLKELQEKFPHREMFLRLDPKIYIVGGTVRDHLLGRNFQDFDILVSDRAIPFAKKISKKLECKVVVLSEEEDEVRLVFTPSCWIDITGRRGYPLNHDLERRDFTINSMAVPLKGVPNLIDPLEGAKDLETRLIRVPKYQNLLDDPLRILRAFRFFATLGFELEKETLQWMSNLAFNLREAARERIRYELILLFSSERVWETLILMKDSGVLEVIFPEILPLALTSQRYYEDQNLLHHSLMTVKKMEELRELFKNLMGPFLRDQGKRALFFLAGLFHDIGKPATLTLDGEGRTRFFDHEVVGASMVKRISKRLKFSKRESETFTHLVRWHMYPHFLAKESNPTLRAMNRFRRRNGELAIPLIFLAMADAKASPPLKERGVGYQFLLEKIVQMMEEVEKKPLEKLITGYDLIEMGLEPGPIFSKILQEIDDLRAEGSIETREEALEAVKRLLREWESQGNRQN